MGVLDVIVISLTLLGFIWGFRKGLIGIIVVVVGLFTTIVLVDAFSEPLSHFFVKVGVSENSSYGVSLLSILLVCFLVFSVIYFLLKSLVDMFRIGWINKTLGAFVGAWVIFVFLGAILFFFSKIPLIGFKKHIDSSLIAKYSYQHAKDLMSLSGTQEKIEQSIEESIK
ncbi:MAG: CvpA family protein [Sulfolobales archaeon]